MNNTLALPCGNFEIENKYFVEPYSYNPEMDEVFKCNIVTPLYGFKRVENVRCLIYSRNLEREIDITDKYTEKELREVKKLLLQKYNERND